MNPMDDLISGGGVFGRTTGVAGLAAQALPVWVMASAFVASLLCAWFLTDAIRKQSARYRHRFESSVDAGLREAFVFVDARRLFQLNLVMTGLFAMLAYLLTGEPSVVLVVLVVSGGLPTLGVMLLRRRRLRQVAAQIPDAVMLVASGLRAGSSLGQAIAMACEELPAPISQEFGMVLKEQRLGLTLESSMGNLERRLPLPEVALLAAAIRVAQESGGNLAETLERLAETVRRKLAVEGRIDALTAQGRLQGWVMALLPVAVAAALFVIEPEAMRPLFGTWYGWGVCAAVCLLEIVGLHFIRRIVKIDV